MAAVELQALLRFLSQDAKVPLATVGITHERLKSDTLLTQAGVEQSQGTSAGQPRHPGEAG